jgi:hypothetical protein
MVCITFVIIVRRVHHLSQLKYSASIINSVFQSNTTPAYFFFDSRDGQASLQSYDGLLRSITYQLCVRLDTLPGVLVTCYKDCGSGATLPSRSDAQQICLSALHHIPETYIIIDALDECSEISQVASWLKKLLTAGGGKLHVLITSRDKPDISVHVSKIPQQQVCYLDESTNADIKLYIDSKMQESRQLTLWSHDIQRNIRERLLDGADGM